MIEDFFGVNTSEIDLTGGTAEVLYGPWCIEAGNTIDLAMQVTISGAVEVSRISLVATVGNDFEILAQSSMTDLDVPSTMGLLYRGKFQEDTELEIVFTSSQDNPQDATIGPRRMQMGYKVYGPDYVVNSTLGVCEGATDD